MKKFKYLNEQEEIYSEAHAKEVLQIKADYNAKVKRLNDELAKKLADLSVKYMKIAQAQQQLAQTQKAAAKVAGTQQPATQNTVTTGTVNTAGMPVNPSGSPTTTQESYSGLLKIRKRVNEEKYDVTDADSDSVQDLKNYMDAENIPYIEDEDDTSLEFDKDELDDEWSEELQNLGFEKTGDVDTSDILDVDDEEDWEQEERERERAELNAENYEDITDTHEDIDESKVFYVKVTDDDGDFVGKIYKLFDDGDWRAKIVSGKSKTFEKLNYDPDFDEFDVIAFLRENYDDAELIDKSEFNDNVEEPTETPEVQESHKIQTFEEFLNETR